MDQQNHSRLFKFFAKQFGDQRSDDPCNNADILSIFCIIADIFFLVALSHLFHFVLKRFGQPAIVSQMLAGFFLGPTLLGQLILINKDSIQLERIALAARIFFMFLVGIEIDTSHLRRLFPNASMINASNISSSMLLSIIASPLLYRLINRGGSVVVFGVTIFLVFFNTASPILIRVVNELKLTMTRIGRLAISAALVTDIMCLVLLAILDIMYGEQNKIGNVTSGRRIVAGLCAFVLLVMTLIVIRSTVKWVNKWNKHKHVVADEVVFYVLMIVFSASLCFEFLGYDPMMGAFTLGLVIQRDGPLARTIIERLTYLVYNVILPIYFGVAGLQVDITFLKFKEVVIMTFAVISLGTLGKIGGTMGVAKYMGMPMQEGLVLSLLLNVKGHVNLMVISFGNKYGIWSDKTNMALLMSLFLNNIVAFPIISAIVRRERQTVRYRSKSLEWLSPQSELRILACVHTPNDAPAILDLVEISSGPNKCRFSPYILHLTELTSESTSTMLYQQLREKEYQNNMRNNHAQQVSTSIDTFVQETDIPLRQLIALSRFDQMHEDLKNRVQDVHASLAIIPFHCKQRFDGKMGSGKEDIRQFNISVLHHVPCSIGILVDRGLGRRQHGSFNRSVPSALSRVESMLLHVVVLFLGGPDDREAASYAGRLALHPCVSVTIMRILPLYRQGTSSRASVCNNIAMDVKGDDADDIFMGHFYNNFVVTGHITYVERLVENSTELITTLSSMEGMYSLYIVGRQVQGPLTQLTDGMSNWEEHPELGVIGDLLASSDFRSHGSVLVIQQCNATSR